MTASFRDWLDRCPTVMPVISLCLGITFATALGMPTGTWSLVGLLPALGLLIAALRTGRTTYFRISVALLFFCVGTDLAARDLLWGKAFLPPSDKVNIHATVRSTLGSAPGSRILLLESGAYASTGKPLPGYGRLFLRDNTLPMCAGDRVAFRSRLKKPANRGNPGEYDWETDCRNAGILWLASVRGEETVVLLRRGLRNTPAAILFRVREAMTRFLESNSGRFLDDDSRTKVRAIHKGIILGDRAEIDAGLNRVFADSGLVHVLSASGVHVSIVVLFTLALVKAFTHFQPRVLLWLPFRKLGALACLPAIVIYCLLVGSKVPAIRATVMGAVVATAILADRRWSSFNSLALAALLILLVYPLSLFTAEFQLSFGAVAGIFIVVNVVLARFYKTDTQEALMLDSGQASGSILKSLNIIPRTLLAVALTSLAATLAVAPLLLRFFNSFPLYTVFSNLLTDFILTAALSLGLAAAATGLVAPGLGAWLLVPADFCVWVSIKVAWIFANLPYSTIRIAHLGPVDFLLTSIVALGLLWYIRNPGRQPATCVAAGVAGLLLLAVSSLWFKSDGEVLKAVFLNVGKGDATFVQVPGSKGLLIDSGEANPHFDAGQSIIIPFLDWNGTRSLDSIVISHPHIDHIGGVLSVMQRVPPSKIWWNLIGQRPAHLVKIFDAARERRIGVLPADRTRDSIRIGPTTLRFLNRPDKRAGRDYSHRDVNNASVAVRLDYGKVSFLFVGDLEKDAEEELLTSGLPLAATVLKVGHHGGKSATTKRFLEAVKPTIAVISADCPPTGGSPHPDTIGRLETAGAKVFWTGRDGAVTVQTDGINGQKVTIGKSSKAIFDETNWTVSTSYENR